MIEVKETNLVKQRCQPELYDPTRIAWNDVRDDILLIERAQFGENAFEENQMHEDFDNPDNTIVLLRDKQINKIVGYSCAEPLLNLDSEDVTEGIKREDDGQKTAYISNTALHPNYVGYGLVGPLINALEEELVKRGYQFIERDSVTKNNYDKKIIKTYGNRILFQSGPKSSLWGPQIFFRIKL